MGGKWRSAQCFWREGLLSMATLLWPRGDTASLARYMGLWTLAARFQQAKGGRDNPRITNISLNIMGSGFQALSKKRRRGDNKGGTRRPQRLTPKRLRETGLVCRGSRFGRARPACSAPQEQCSAHHMCYAIHTFASPAQPHMTHEIAQHMCHETKINTIRLTAKINTNRL